MSRRAFERKERAYHEQWLGMAQPSEGLVLSVPSPFLADGIHRLAISPGGGSGEPVRTFTFRVRR